MVIIMHNVQITFSWQLCQLDSGNSLFAWFCLFGSGYLSAHCLSYLSKQNTSLIPEWLIKKHKIFKMVQKMDGFIAVLHWINGKTYKNMDEWIDQLMKRLMDEVMDGINEKSLEPQKMKFTTAFKLAPLANMSLPVRHMPKSPSNMKGEEQQSSGMGGWGVLQMNHTGIHY